MKFALTLLFLTAISSALALSNSMIVSGRAHTRRDLVDICAALDIELGILGLLGLGDPLIGGLYVCLCVSELPIFITTNADAKLAVELTSEQRVLDTLGNLIRTSPTTQSCSYPPHSESICDFDDPCKFQCINGFHLDNHRSCICPPPHIECNGHCGDFKNGCASIEPAFRRDVDVCGKGRERCRLGRSERWECVDPKTDPKSCGGCSSEDSGKGEDCTSIAHADTVSCHDGKCHVLKCAMGYILSPSRDSCLRFL